MCCYPQMNMFSYPKESNTNKMMLSSSSSFSTSSSYNNINNEDFSFPVISNNNPLSNFMLSSSSASSSSLWRISSRVYHHQVDYYDESKYEEIYDGGYDRIEVRSMSEEILPSRRESVACTSFQSKDFEVEERMDYLWEDFNEEEKNEVKERKLGEEIAVLQMRMSRRQSSRSRSSGNSSSSKMLVLGKLLKGLVSIRRSAQNKASKTRF